jgi:hypothetical protein
MSSLSHDIPFVICHSIGSLQQLLESVYMEFYILKRSFSLGMTFCRFSSRGLNDQGTKWPGTKWPGTKWPGTKCMRGLNDRDKMSGDEMKGDEVLCHRHKHVKVSHSITMCRNVSHLFFNAFILWNDDAIVHYTWPLTMRDSTSYADPGLKMRDTFALATVFVSKVGPGAPPL